MIFLMTKKAKTSFQDKTIQILNPPTIHSAALNEQHSNSPKLSTIWELNQSSDFRNRLEETDCKKVHFKHQLFFLRAEAEDGRWQEG